MQWFSDGKIEMVPKLWLIPCNKKGAISSCTVVISPSQLPPPKACQLWMTWQDAILPSPDVIPLSRVLHPPPLQQLPLPAWPISWPPSDIGTWHLLAFFAASVLGTLVLDPALEAVRELAWSPASSSNLSWGCKPRVTASSSLKEILNFLQVLSVWPMHYEVSQPCLRLNTWFGGQKFHFLVLSTQFLVLRTWFVTLCQLQAWANEPRCLRCDGHFYTSNFKYPAGFGPELTMPGSFQFKFRVTVWPKFNAQTTGMFSRSFTFQPSSLWDQSKKHPYTLWTLFKSKNDSTGQSAAHIICAKV